MRILIGYKIPNNRIIFSKLEKNHIKTVLILSFILNSSIIKTKFEMPNKNLDSKNANHRLRDL
jgi:hypothetical protein